MDETCSFQDGTMAALFHNTVESSESPCHKSEMSPKNIVEVEILSSDEILGFWLDEPLPGEQPEMYSIHVRGWVIGKRKNVVEVQIKIDQHILVKTPVNVIREDVGKKYPAALKNNSFGFDVRIGLTGLSNRQKLTVQAVFEEKENHNAESLAHITLSRRCFYQGETLLAPLMITSMGRTGTTWSMRLLSQHPSIVIYKKYPYEAKVGLNSTLNFIILSGLFENNLDPELLHLLKKSKLLAGHNIRDQQTRNLLERSYYKNLIDCTRNIIDNFYRQIAAAQGISAPVYFAEKFLLDQISAYWAQDIVREIYPNAREIFLIRDLRDVVTSVLAFNKKRGWMDFGRDRFDSDEEYIRAMGRVSRFILKRWERVQTSVYLLRYEDLILQPFEAMKGLLEYLHLENDDLTLHSMMNDAMQFSKELEEHRTTETPLSSVGRWSRELSPHLQALANQEFGEMLTAYGYGV
jgi:hypothetical protein